MVIEFHRTSHRINERTNVWTNMTLPWLRHHYYQWQPRSGPSLKQVEINMFTIWKSGLWSSDLFCFFLQCAVRFNCCLPIVYVHVLLFSFTCVDSIDFVFLVNRCSGHPETRQGVKIGRAFLSSKPLANEWTFDEFEHEAKIKRVLFQTAHMLFGILTVGQCWK